MSSHCCCYYCMGLFQLVTTECVSYPPPTHSSSCSFSDSPSLLPPLLLFLLGVLSHNETSRCSLTSTNQLRLCRLYFTPSINESCSSCHQLTPLPAPFLTLLPYCSYSFYVFFSPIKLCTSINRLRLGRLCFTPSNSESCSNCHPLTPFD